jgi:Na+-translocating ferredoxin:NAD+ oxidoreductase subunit B
MNTAIALSVMIALSGLFVLAHRWLHHLHLRTNATTREALIDSIDALLPQTQCGRCTFNGCRPYATALARGEADINQCPPGGRTTASALAKLLPPCPVDCIDMQPAPQRITASIRRFA